MALPTLNPSFDDQTAIVKAARGYIGGLDPCVIRSKDGRVVWNNDEYSFLQGQCPPTVHPNLWRQSQVGSRQGLFEVTSGIYQVRGLDLSNMTIIEGTTGVILIDPLISIECAEAALGLYYEHRGQKPVRALIYTHSHVDHFGGALGVLPPSNNGSYDIPIIAPEGFMEEALSENVFAGPAMRRRAICMYGSALPKDPEGQVGVGLGMTTSLGSTSLVPPNDIVHHTGEERTIDGVRMVFQMVPETEAPCEFNLYFPDHRALCIAECATNGMHNIITLRGAQVRDAKMWASYLDETIALYGHKSDVLFAGHHWPTWDSDTIIAFISEQRDLYAYLHDQTLRLINQGLNGAEIAEQLSLPPALQQAWHARGFYGSVSHNVKGIYQRYMTWFDANPANLWKHPPAEEGKRYVACIGGVDAVIKKAKSFVEEQGDLRFAATLLDHAVAAEPQNQSARSELASVYQKLGFGAENATWRNFYLTAAQELKKKPPVKATTQGNVITSPRKSLSSINPQATIPNWFDSLSVQLDGPRACTSPLAFVILFVVPNLQTTWRLRLSNGALTHRKTEPEDRSRDAVDLTLTMDKKDVFHMLTTGDMQVVRENSDGDIGKLETLLDLCGAQVEVNRDGDRPSRL